MIQIPRGRRRASVAQIDMAPLIDIVFILLIFFLVTTTFAADVGLAIDRPEAATSSALPGAAERVAVGAEGRIWLRGERIDLDALRRRIGAARDRGVVVVADAACPSGRLVEVIDAIRAAGLIDVAVATRTPAGAER